MKLGVVLVHGIGIQDPEWAEGIIRALRDAVAQAVPRVLPAGAGGRRAQVGVGLGGGKRADGLRGHCATVCRV